MRQAIPQALVLPPSSGNRISSYPRAFDSAIDRYPLVIDAFEGEMPHEGAVGAALCGPEISLGVDTQAGNPANGRSHFGDFLGLFLAVSIGIDPEVVTADATRGNRDFAVVAEDLDIIDHALAGSVHDQAFVWA